MKIGIVADIAEDYHAAGYSEEQTAEFDRRDTIDAIATSIKKMRYNAEYIGNAFVLMNRLLKGERWDLIFNISEGLYGFGRESLVPTILDQYKIPYTFSSPDILAVTLQKQLAKDIMIAHNIPTPKYYVVKSISDLDKVDLPFPLFTKPLAEGTSKGIYEDSIVYNSLQLKNNYENLLWNFRQPVLVEQYIDGPEFTVGILKNVPIGALEITYHDKDKVYSYKNKQDCEIYTRYTKAEGDLANEACKMAKKVWDVFGCFDAGRVDVRFDTSNNIYVLELNPLAGLHPEHSDLPILCKMCDISYDTLIKQIIDSCCSRNQQLYLRENSFECSVI